MHPYVIAFEMPSGEPCAVEVMAYDEEHARDVFVSGNRDLAKLHIDHIAQMTLQEWTLWTGMAVG